MDERLTGMTRSLHPSALVIRGEGRRPAMDPSLWPRTGLRVPPAGRELRPPTDADLPALAALYPSDVAFDPTLPLPAGERGARARQAVLRHVWRSRAELAPEAWRICFGAYEDGGLVGQQDLKAVGFPL